MNRLVQGSFLLLLAGIACAADWTGFRGTNGTSVSKEKNLPVKWSGTEGILYKVALPGQGLSNPVISNGKVYVTACSGYRETRLHLLCFDEKTGKKLWERQLTATGNTTCNKATNMAAPTPVCDAKNVYTLFATGDLAAFDGEGNLVWYRSLVSDYPNITNQVGMASSLVVVGDVLFLPMDNAGDSFAAGIDTKTGKNLWKVNRGKLTNWVTPLVYTSAGKSVIVYNNGGTASAYDPKTGEVKWQYKGEGLSTIPSLSSGQGMIFLPGGKAIRPRPESEAPELVWEGKSLSGGYATPVFYEGRVYAVTGPTVVVVDAKTGEEKSKTRIDGPIDGSPVIADGKLYVVNRKGQTFVYELGDKPKLLARNDLGDQISATPAIANGKLFLRSDKYLYCIGKK